MARKPRIVAVDCAHHVAQRGNNQQEVFFSDTDRRMYLRLLARHSAKHQLDLLGFCLMPDHVHLIVIPRQAGSLSKALAHAHAAYTVFVNRVIVRTGHLWQNRFRSCPLDSSHAWSALRYVEMNPVRAGLVDDPLKYPWSSAAVHVGEKPRYRVPLQLDEWNASFTASQWREFLAAGSEAETDELRAHTLKGSPLGGQQFIVDLETELGLRARPVARERPATAGGSS